MNEATMSLDPGTGDAGVADVRFAAILANAALELPQAAEQAG